MIGEVLTADQGEAFDLGRKVKDELATRRQWRGWAIEQATHLPRDPVSRAPRMVDEVIADAERIFEWIAK